MDLVVVSFVQIFEIFKLFPCLYPIYGPEDPPATLGELIYPVYYVWDTTRRRCARTVRRTAIETAITAWELRGVRQLRNTQRMNGLQRKKKANMCQ